VLLLLSLGCSKESTMKMPWTCFNGQGHIKATKTTPSTVPNILGERPCTVMDKDCKRWHARRIGCGNVPKIITHCLWFDDPVNWCFAIAQKGNGSDPVSIHVPFDLEILTAKETSRRIWCSSFWCSFIWLQVAAREAIPITPKQWPSLIKLPPPRLPTCWLFKAPGEKLECLWWVPIGSQKELCAPLSNILPSTGTYDGS